jgi:biopolymer transport protein TolR
MTSGSGSGVTSDINVTPMADVMLVLLIIFMITAPLLQEGIYVNKAKARNAQEAPEIEGKDSTIVTITRSGEIYVNSEIVPPTDLVDRLTERALLAPDKPLFVKGDVAAKYGTVVDVINKARDAQIERIGLMVDRDESSGGR